MTTLILVGLGNMGSAMLASWHKTTAHGISDYYYIDKNISVQKDAHHLSLDTIPGNVKPDVIVFAVKPQDLENILPQYRERFSNHPLYISIAAGKTLEFFAKHLGADAKVVRAMPNTPALIGKAMTGLCANQNVSEQEKIAATKIIESFGKSVWVDEKNMDAVTAVSGSGPAYVFLFLDALTKAGINSGLDAEAAKKLALEMVHGSLHLAAQSADDFEKLRENVTSKGGTTEAALEVLMRDNALQNLINDAVQAAVARAKKLA